MNLNKIKAKLDSIADGFEGVEAKVGWFESAKYENGTSVASVALIQEQGAPAASIPARPFIAPTVAAQSDAWRDLMESGVRAVVKGRYTALQVLEGVGLQAAGDIRETISKISTPPLSPITLMLRKWRREGRTITGATVGAAALAVAAGESVEGVPTTPLQDTGLMIATLSNTVGKEDD